MDSEITRIAKVFVKGGRKVSSLFENNGQLVGDDAQFVWNLTRLNPIYQKCYDAPHRWLDIPIHEKHSERLTDMFCKYFYISEPYDYRQCSIAKAEGEEVKFVFPAAALVSDKRKYQALDFEFDKPIDLRIYATAKRSDILRQISGILDDLGIHDEVTEKQAQFRNEIDKAMAARRGVATRTGRYVDNMFKCFCVYYYLKITRPTLSEVELRSKLVELGFDEQTRITKKTRDGYISTAIKDIHASPWMFFHGFK